MINDLRTRHWKLMLRELWAGWPWVSFKFRTLHRRLYSHVSGNVHLSPELRLPSTSLSSGTVISRRTCKLPTWFWNWIQGIEYKTNEALSTFCRMKMDIHCQANIQSFYVQCTYLPELRYIILLCQIHIHPLGIYNIFLDDWINITQCMFEFLSIFVYLSTTKSRLLQTNIRCLSQFIYLFWQRTATSSGR